MTPLPSATTVRTVIKRYIKPGVTPTWIKDIPAFHALWHAYPSLPFWMRHEVGFPLNSMLWFLTEQGQTHLKSAYLVFHWNPDPPEPARAEELPGPVDKTPPTAYHTLIPKPRTTADYLSGGKK